MLEWGNSLAVQRLGLCALTAEGLGSIPGRGTKILQAARCSRREEIKMPEWSTALKEELDCGAGWLQVKKPRAGDALCHPLSLFLLTRGSWYLFFPSGWHLSLLTRTQDHDQTPSSPSPRAWKACVRSSMQESPGKALLAQPHRIKLQSVSLSAWRDFSTVDIEKTLNSPL